MRQPVMVYGSLDQAEASLKEWQERLFLQDWIIKLELCDKSGDNDFGEAVFNSASQKATVRLYQASSEVSEVKKCMEKTLVHELLHLSLHVCGYGEEMKVEECLFDTFVHRKVEKLAQSLIMAKYDIPFEWFRNF